MLARFSKTATGVLYYANNNNKIKYGDLFDSSKDDTAILGDGKNHSIIFITD